MYWMIYMMASVDVSVLLQKRGEVFTAGHRAENNGNLALEDVRVVDLKGVGYEVSVCRT